MISRKKSKTSGFKITRNKEVVKTEELSTSNPRTPQQVPRAEEPASLEDGAAALEEEQSKEYKQSVVEEEKKPGRDRESATERGNKNDSCSFVNIKSIAASPGYDLKSGENPQTLREHDAVQVGEYEMVTPERHPRKGGTEQSKFATAGAAGVAKDLFSVREFMDDRNH